MPQVRSVCLGLGFPGSPRISSSSAPLLLSLPHTCHPACPERGRRDRRPAPFAGRSGQIAAKPPRLAYFGLRRLAAAFTASAPTQKLSSRSRKAGPDLSFAPPYGASGRVVEGSLLLLSLLFSVLSVSSVVNTLSLFHSFSFLASLCDLCALLSVISVLPSLFGFLLCLLCILYLIHLAPPLSDLPPPPPPVLNYSSTSSTARIIHRGGSESRRHLPRHRSSALHLRRRSPPRRCPGARARSQGRSRHKEAKEKAATPPPPMPSRLPPKKPLRKIPRSKISSA